MRALLCFIVLLLMARSSFADEATKARANALYREGIAHHKAGRLQDAAQAFEASYAAHPHYKTLYNIGRTYAALDRPVKAAHALEQFLKDGGRAIDPARRNDAEGLLGVQLEQVGMVTFELSPPRAVIRVDGTPITETRTVRLRVGLHAIAATASGHHASEREVTVHAKQHHTLAITLEPLPPPKPPMGELQVICDLAQVTVHANGKRRGMTPLKDPFSLPVGTHRVRFSRSGFEPTAARVTVAYGETTNVACDMQPLSALPAASSGTLIVAPSEVEVDVQYNGWPLPTSGRVPMGPHVITAMREDFEVWRRTIVVPAGETVMIDAVLVPTPAFREAYERQAHAQRIAAYTLVGSGVATLVIVAGLGIYRQGQFSDWEAEQAALANGFASFPTGADAEALSERQIANDSLGEDIQLIDYAMLGLGIGGGALLAAGTLSWAFGDAPERYVRVAGSPYGVTASGKW